MDTHHHDSGSEAAGAASWMVAMVIVAVLIVALFVALFAWQPWDDNSTNTSGGTGTEQQDGNSDINIDGNIDVDPNAPEPTG